MKDININSFEDLEFYFLKDLSGYENKEYIDVLVEECYSIYAVIDNQVLVKTDRGGYMVYSDVSTDNLKEGDIVLESDDTLIKIESKDTANILRDILKDKRISIYEFRNNLPKDIKEITKDSVNSVVDIFVKKMKDDELEKEKQRIQYEKEQEKERKEAEKRDMVLQKYNTTGEYVKGDIMIKGNTLTILSKKFILGLDTGNIKDYIPYSYIESNIQDSYNFEHNELRTIIGGLINKKVAFKITINGKESHFTFNKERLLFNDIPIQKQSALKVFKWVTNSKEDIPTEKIKAYSRLSGIKFKVLNDITHLELQVNGRIIKLPLIINYIDDNLMEVEFLGKKKVFDWKLLKGYLAYGMSISNYFYNTRIFFEFINHFNMEKKDMYEQIRLIMSIGEL